MININRNGDDDVWMLYEVGGAQRLQILPKLNRASHMHEVSAVNNALRLNSCSTCILHE